MSVYLDICIGDRDAYFLAQASYKSTCALLEKNRHIYCLPHSPPDLSQEQQEILKELDKSTELRFTEPMPLLAGRLIIDLDASPGLSKTTANFRALCTGEKGMCKNAPNKKLHYLDCPLHRIVKGFVAQGGDVTRGDGAGGESIYGAKFNDEKPGLRARPQRGSIAMANSGKNTNTSQFFIALTSDEAKLRKIQGNYVVFGRVVEGLETLDRLDDVGGGANGKPTENVWVGGCGACS